ncbi:MAG: hypothetical protein J0L61_11335 [Planctomycetes bacterium]|nr:hypothetical protein [Planctomycetota bacterium]
MSVTTTVPGEPVLPDVKMHAVRPTEPVFATITKNERCTVSKKTASYIRQVEFDVSGTPLVGVCNPGQAIGVLAEGNDATGKPHKVRLYSLSSPKDGIDGQGKVYSVTVKRSIDEHWDTKKLFMGVCSNYLCDRAVGDKIRVSGPNGKRFLLPVDPNKNDYMFFATGTGIAPFRGMLLDLFKAKCTSKITLVMGAPPASDLLYHDFFLDMQTKFPNFTYLTAISREKQADGHDQLYVQDRLRTNRDQLLAQLSNDRNCIYICGLAGMELGIFQQLGFILQGSTLEQYLQCDPQALRDIRHWKREMLHKEIRPTKRVLMEVYA